MEAHKKRIEQYEEAIRVYKAGNKEEGKHLVADIIDNCTHCKACPKDIGGYMDCSKCVLGDPNKAGETIACVIGDMKESRKRIRLIYYDVDGVNPIDALEQRLDALVLQAEFNLSE